MKEKRPELHSGLFSGPESLRLEELYLLRLEPIGKRMFDCVLGYYPRLTMLTEGKLTPRL